MRGVYAVGWPQLTRERRWMAAILACGEGAVLSHRSAAALWGIGGERSGRTDVSVRRRCELRRPGLRVRGRPRRLERAVNEADKRDLVDPEGLRAALDRFKGEPGAPTLRMLLDRRTFRLSDSDLEILFRPIAETAGLPPPLSKQIVNGWEVDFYWPDLDLVIETDGLRYHRTASTQTRDVRRDRAHALAGMTPLRFTHYEVKHERNHVLEELRRARTLLQQGASDIDHT